MFAWGESIRLAESFALIWNTTRISNSLTAFRQKKKLNGKNGLLVIDSTGAAAQAGIRRGDVILGLNNSESQSVELFNKQINSVAAGKTVAVLVLRGESTLYVPIKVSK